MNLSTLLAIPFYEALSQFPEQDRYPVEERAGIHEFDGHLPRPEAEQQALRDWFKEQGRLL